MRRHLLVLAIGAIAIGATGVTPASADAPPWPINCVTDYGTVPPGAQSVYVDSSGRLVVNPEAAPGDVDAFAAWAPDKLLAMYPCLVGPVFIDGVVCTYQKAFEAVDSLDPTNSYLRYVYPNPNGPGYVVDHPRLLADVSHVVGCLATV
ncbi:MAG TPA: hypothetical protein VEV43_06310 [Actinomycetota bacterium]|nr:hypothetical protein [Actinomycetota bacterium]